MNRYVTLSMIRGYEKNFYSGHFLKDESRSDMNGIEWPSQCLKDDFLGLIQDGSIDLDHFKGTNIRLNRLH